MNDVPMLLHPDAGDVIRGTGSVHKIRWAWNPRALRQEDTPMAQVNFRMSSERLALIDRVAAIRGVTRTEFVLRSSEAAAIETLNERPIIALDDEVREAFTAALGAPVEPDLAVKARFAREPRWER